MTMPRTIRGVMRRLGFRESHADRQRRVDRAGGRRRPARRPGGRGRNRVDCLRRERRRGGGARRRLGPRARRRGLGLLDRPARARRAVMRDADGRGPQDRADAAGPRALLACRVPTTWWLKIYEGAERRQLVATLGQLVERARADGDAVAAEILRQAANELVQRRGVGRSAASTCAATCSRPFSPEGCSRPFRGWPSKWRRAWPKWRLAPRPPCCPLNPPSAPSAWLAPKPRGGARVPVYLDSAVSLS